MTNQTERNRRGREILAELGRRFPHLFAVEVWESHLPLVIGIDAVRRAVCFDADKFTWRRRNRWAAGSGAFLSTGTWRVAGLLNFPCYCPLAAEAAFHIRIPKSNPNFKQQVAQEAETVNYESTTALVLLLGSMTAAGAQYNPPSFQGYS